MTTPIKWLAAGVETRPHPRTRYTARPYHLGPPPPTIAEIYAASGVTWREATRGIQTIFDSITALVNDAWNEINDAWNEA